MSPRSTYHLKYLHIKKFLHLKDQKVYLKEEIKILRQTKKKERKMLLELKRRKVCIITCVWSANFHYIATDCLDMSTVDESRQSSNINLPGASQQPVRLTKTWIPFSNNLFQFVMPFSFWDYIGTGALQLSCYWSCCNIGNKQYDDAIWR